MASTQLRLITAIRDAMAAKGVKVKELATAIGTTPSNLSYVLNGMGSMSVGRWQIACDKLGLDYDEVVMDYQMPDEPSAGEEAQGPAEEKQGEPEVVPEQEEAPGIEADDDLTYDNIILADYALEKLRLDIRQGTDMQPKRLYELMRAIERSGAMTIV